MSTSEPPAVVIVGAGPAGLTAAYQLVKADIAPVILEADSVVGGISRTAQADGWRFDIGGHRFFTKVAPVEALWHEILADDEFLVRPRMSRIYYQGKFYDYPIRPMNALRNLGVIEATRCVASYLWARVHPPADQTTLEGYIAANYGWRLYRHFFKTYNETVWGVSAAELSADFGAQRIKGMSLFQAVWEPVRSRVFGARRNKSAQVTSLIEQFQYPKFGPGMMWERCRELVEGGGAKVIMDTPVTRIHHDGRHAVSVEATCGGAVTDYPADHVISSMPLPELLRIMDPPVPDEVRTAADQLSFRDFITVALVVPESAAFPDNWIYIHSLEARPLGRIQNFGAWSPYLVKDGRTCLGLEYFVFEGDGVWSSSDDELVARATRDLQQLGLVDPAAVEAGYVVRMPKAYPVYDEDYKAHVAVLRDWLREHAPNVHPVGRNGMHKYNNQDHSMYTAMLTVENILGADHDIWSVNVEEEYHEEGSTGRDAPVVPRRSAPVPRQGGTVSR
jgi:protoporphyrinogen oxidase